MRNMTPLWRKAMVALFIALILLLLMGVTFSNAAPPGVGPIYHVVKPGENLSAIAARYCTTVWAIARANGIWNPNCIYAGQVLYIPGEGCYQPCYKPCWGVQVPCAQPCYQPCPPPYGDCARAHIVRWGEDLTKIAWRYGTTVWAIAQANGIWNPNFIYVGQRLTIPCN